MIDCGPKLSSEHDGLSWTSARIGRLPLIGCYLVFSPSCLSFEIESWDYFQKNCNSQVSGVETKIGFV